MCNTFWNNLIIRLDMKYQNWETNLKHDDEHVSRLVRWPRVTHSLSVCQLSVDTCCVLCPHCVYPAYWICSETQKPAVLNPELSSWLTQWPIDSLISFSLSMFFQVWLCKSLFCKWPTWFSITKCIGKKKKQFDHYCCHYRIPCFCFRIWRKVV